MREPPDLLLLDVLRVKGCVMVTSDETRCKHKKSEVFEFFAHSVVV